MRPPGHAIGVDRPAGQDRMGGSRGAMGRGHCGVQPREPGAAHPAARAA